MLYVYPRLKKWDMGITINGFLGGLVAITAPCYWVNATGAVDHRRRSPASIVVLGVDLIEHFRIDDPIGAVAVHGVLRHLGHAGPSACSPPASSDGVEGLFWGGGGKQLWAQIWGNAVDRRRRLRRRLRRCFMAINALGLLRVSEEGELEGIDIHEHGAPAYHPEPAYMGQGAMTAEHGSHDWTELTCRN